MKYEHHFNRQMEHIFHHNRVLWVSNRNFNVHSTGCLFGWREYSTFWRKQLQVHLWQLADSGRRERAMLALALLNSSSANHPMHIRYLHCLNCLQRFLWPVWAPNGPQIAITAVCLRLTRGTKQRIMDRPSALPSDAQDETRACLLPGSNWDRTGTGTAGSCFDVAFATCQVLKG